MYTTEHTNQSSMSEIIRAAARQTVEQTKEAVRLAEETEPCEDFVIIMVNGVETKLNRSDYESLKQKNREVRIQMKEQLKAFLL